MRHISSKDDWFYEFRPYIIIGIGTVGLLSRSFFGSSQALNAIGFICSVILLGLGSIIISWRREHRKTSFMK